MGLSVPEGGIRVVPSIRTMAIVPENWLRAP